MRCRRSPTACPGRTWPSANPSRLSVSFFDDPIDPRALTPILDTDWSPERFAIGKGVTYAWHPDGVTGSKLAETLLRAKGPVGTARNLKTIMKVLDRA